MLNFENSTSTLTKLCIDFAQPVSTHTHLSINFNSCDYHYTHSCKINFLNSFKISERARIKLLLLILNRQDNCHIILQIMKMSNNKIIIIIMGCELNCARAWTWSIGAFVQCVKSMVASEVSFKWSRTPLCTI